MKKISFVCVCFIYIFPGCSLKYGTNYQDEENVPEFIFSDSNYNRYEDGKKSMSLSASRLEQYSDGKSMYAKDVDFKIMNDEGEVETHGSCSLLSSDTNEKEYYLYDNILIESKKDELTVSADTLHWNGKNEQLTSGKTDTVTIKKGNAVIHGSGFSASGVSKKFVFNGVVTGQYETEDSNKTEDSNEEGDKIEKNQ